MAVSIAPQITGQAVTSTTTYSYLYEPLKINVTESSGTATKIFIDLTVYNTVDNVLVTTESEYGMFDINSGSSLEVDLMRLAEQYHDANVFKIGVLADISSREDIPVSKYKYEFKIYSDEDSTGQTVSKLPIIGGRNYFDFAPNVKKSNSTTEAELYGVDLTGRWLNYPNISTSLATPSGTNATPTITITTESTAELEPCGGMLIWKSRFGGWMYWGMDIMTRAMRSRLQGNLTVGMFEATAGGDPYVQADYTRVDITYSLSLKALSLTSSELEAVEGITASSAIYYMANPTAKLELMRLKSATTPISSLTGGGDFSVSLDSISTSSQKTR